MSDTFDSFDGSSDNTPFSPELAALIERVETDAVLWEAHAPADDGRIAAYARELAGGATQGKGGIALLERPRVDASRSAAIRSAATRQPRAGRALAYVSAVLVVAIIAVSLTIFHRPTTTVPTSTPAATATATATAVPSPTATSTATPQPTATPTQVPDPIVPLSARLVPQPDGQLLVPHVMQTCSPGGYMEINFEIDVLVSHSNPGYITFHWQHYDGAVPGEPTAGTVTFNQGPSDVTPAYMPNATSPDPGSRLNAFQEDWKVYSPAYTGSSARWGTQLVLTAFNDQPLATPIASNVVHFATGC